MERRLIGFEIPLGKPLDADSLKSLLSERLALRIEAIEEIRVVRRALDARKGRKTPVWVLTLDLRLRDRPGRLPPGLRLQAVPGPPPPPTPPVPSLRGLAAVVVGSGPAGLFAAEALLKRGAEVAVVEQGPPLPERVEAVKDLWRLGTLNPDANVQFGEGGAGTFSDGKLTTRIKDDLRFEVLRRFVEAGAPPAILEDAHPHLGTDGVRQVVKTFRRQLEERGARFFFREALTDLERRGSMWRLRTSAGEREADLVVLAVGHSSRRLFRRLFDLGLPVRPKGFAVGVRAEHPQEWVDERQYGRFAGHPDLSPAEYFLTYKDLPTGRGVYSFCMCPGGLVVNSSSEEGRLVTNGMSMSHRASGFANAGIVVTVFPEDFGSDPRKGLDFQEELEAKAFRLGGGDFRAPAQSVMAFLQNRSDAGPLKTTFRPGVRAVNLRGFFPPWVEEPLTRALTHFDRLMPGFVEKGILLAPETRTSSPFQVVRGESGEPPGFPGLLLAGEGAGWSGGIVSSALDGLRIVERFAEGRG